MNEDEDLFGNLDKWQASSHPRLANCAPEELFEADDAKRYRDLHHSLWARLIRLHGTIRTLGTLEQFPFDQLYAPDGMEFWRLVYANFYDVAIIVLHGLLNDQGEDAHSLRSFKNALLSSAHWRWRDSELRQLFTDVLRDRKFDARAGSIARRVTAIRNNRVAHVLVDLAAGQFKQAVESVNLPELRRLFDATHALFGAVSFGAAFVTLAGDLIPSTVAGKPVRSCLDSVLDAVLKDSDIVNEPERRPQRWARLRTKKSEGQLAIRNSLRKRIGLPEA
ncbi:MAG TPA: hypothetical protein VM243_14970 [Phycisphaerae bacterium]|nr:hypothetical protein [Phycisphaerae bacterium]